MKQENGITLMALVITIIILLILAGITIASITGEKGIIKEARTAKELTELAALEEQVELAIIKAEQKHRNPGIDDVIEEIKNNKVISNADQVNKETGVIRTDAGYEITGKLDDYIGKISIGDNTGNNTGDNTGDISKPGLAKDILKIDSTATDESTKSSHVRYNGLDCRVLYNDALHGVQIVSSESIGNVTLGSDDADVTSSDFTYDGPNSVDGNSLKAAASYNNVINNLNKKAKSCMDSKGIALDARCLGSTPVLSSDSKFYSDTSAMSSYNYTYMTTYKWNNKLKSSDTNYTEDVNQLNSLGLNSSENTWLASRNVMPDEAVMTFQVRYVKSSGQISSEWIFQVYSDDGPWPRTSVLHGFRPVFLLGSDVIISKGNGSSGNPYIIE